MARNQHKCTGVIAQRNAAPNSAPDSSLERLSQLVCASTERLSRRYICVDLAICQSSLIGLWLRIRHLDDAAVSPAWPSFGHWIAGHVGDVLGLDAERRVLAFDPSYTLCVDRDGLGSIDTAAPVTTDVDNRDLDVVADHDCLVALSGYTNILAPSLPCRCFGCISRLTAPRCARGLGKTAARGAPSENRRGLLVTVRRPIVHSARPSHLS